MPRAPQDGCLSTPRLSLSYVLIMPIQYIYLKGDFTDGLGLPDFTDSVRAPLIYLWMCTFVVYLFCVKDFEYTLAHNNHPLILGQGAVLGL